ncbi:hypothetical protein GCM10011390_24230 [Aureimonas endophytica]|uniref:EamA domain-containing protein n=1 Tax=Aureimonas endophytica TaxID=2027858 RepID=A0A917E4T5_9HYPH|nr:hypothetical protein [Aureimonas endophytica]GGE04459.1 hypothetical protein GCM10011390_24230 [Aureimonas endophytica]
MSGRAAAPLAAVAPPDAVRSSLEGKLGSSPEDGAEHRQGGPPPQGSTPLKEAGIDRAPTLSLLHMLPAWAALVACETLAQAAMKAGGEGLAGLPFGAAFLRAALAEPWVIVGALGYLGSFAAWMAILDKVPLSRGFPMSAVVALAIVAAGVLGFGEAVGPARGAGILLILAGLVVMGNEAT